MVLPHLPRETLGTEVGSRRRRWVLRETAGSRDRVPFGHEMRDLLLAEDREDAGVVPPEETGHFALPGIDLSWR